MQDGDRSPWAQALLAQLRACVCVAQPAGGPWLPEDTVELAGQ